MSDAEAAIHAANITLWGAIIVGTLAMVGTIVSTVIAPGMRARAEARERRENARIDALREIIPQMVTIALKNRFREVSSPVELGELAAMIVKFEMWLSPDEAVAGKIARHALVMGHGPTSSDEVNAKETEEFTSATGLLPLWVRGELTTEELADRFKKQTGVDFTRGATPS